VKRAKSMINHQIISNIHQFSLKGLEGMKLPP